MSLKYLVVIVGPTAVGKTALSIQVAKEFNTEIISADSRQFFREMNIGTAKPSQEELKIVKHHFIDSHSINDDYNVGKYEQDALNVLEELFKTKNIIVLTGGSGLYIDAVCKGLDEIPNIEPELREELNKIFKEKGIEEIRLMLKKHDPEYFNTVDLANPQRMIRALEVSLTTSLPYSSFRKKGIKNRKFQIVKIGLTMPREELYERINKRVDNMMKEELLEEVKSLFAFKGHNALQTVGYKELFDHISGKIELNKAIDLIKQNTRNYAKRQLTWFRKDKEIQWFEPKEVEEIIEYVKNKVKS